MKNMEQLRFMVDLDWKIRFSGFDKIFSDADYFGKFMAFLHTETGRKWLTKENGLAFKEWQEG